MTRSLLAVVPMLILGAASLGHAQVPQSSSAGSSLPPPVQTDRPGRSSEDDGSAATSIRSGTARTATTRKAPNAANYDESKANPYPNLPDPLVLKNGKKVTTAEMWWKQRRPEIVEDFDREIYGRVPKETPKVKWEVTDTTKREGRRRARRHEAAGRPRRQLLLPADHRGYPADADHAGERHRPGAGDHGVRLRRRLSRASARPVRPLGALGPPGRLAAAGAGEGLGLCDPHPHQHPGRQRRGPDQGIIGLCNKGQPRKLDDWGALRAWAWGASRALDYFETDKAVDAKQVGIEGHSRYGKAAIVTMAYDTRFAIAFVSSSGEGGAKMHRRNWGELVENVAGTGEYHWMAGNFLKYAGPLKWNDLPVDSHELVALCAPRPVFISGGATKSATAGWTPRACSWPASAPGRFTSCWARRTWGLPRFPPIETGADRRRRGLPPAQRRPHARPELADVPEVRRPLHQGAVDRRRSQAVQELKALLHTEQSL